MRRLVFLALAAIPIRTFAACPPDPHPACVKKTIVRPPNLKIFLSENIDFLAGHRASGSEMRLPKDLVTHIRQLGTSDFVVIESPTTAKAIELRDQLSPAFGAREDASISLSASAAVREDPLLAEQWDMDKIHMRQAWPIASDSSSVVVAVVDTAIQTTHPDLRRNMWRARSHLMFDTVTRTVNCREGDWGYDAIHQTCHPGPGQNHGTHVAGIIGAAGDNGVGIAGIGWRARILPVEAFGPDPGTNEIVGCESDVIEALEFVLAAKDQGETIGVLNASWGSEEESPRLKEEIQKVSDAGILVVAAAGNCSENIDSGGFYPASWSVSIQNVLSVLASDECDRRNWNTNWGLRQTQIAAPGSALLSTFPIDTYRAMFGTSMAAAHVSGAAALIMAVCHTSAQQTKDILIASADEVDSLRALVAKGRRLNVERALRQCKSGKAQ
jgi:serine protease